MTHERSTELNIRRSILSGSSWSGIAEAIRIGSSSLVILILAALLSPQDFGVVGMTDVLISFFILTTNLGFESAIVQQEHITEEILSSLFWINLVLGIGLTILGIALAPSLALFYRDPRVEPVFVALSFTFILQSLTVVQKGLLYRNMAFREMSIVDIIATVISAVIGISVGYITRSYWALVALQLTRTLFLACGYWWQSPWRPSRQFNLAESRKSLGFSMNMLAFNWLNFMATQFDALLIGRFLGADQLGYYLLAKRIVVRPTLQVANLVMRTLYPILSTLQNDLSRMRKVFLKVVYVLMVVIAPMVIALAIVTPLIVPVLLGDQWLPIIPIVIVWCLAVVYQTLTTRTGVIFLATGRPDLQWKFQLFSTPIVLLGLVLGIRQGALGVSITYNLAQVLVSFVSMYLGLRLIEMTVAEYFIYFRALIMALVAEMAVGFFLLDYAMAWGIPQALTIVIVGAVALTSFGVVWLLVDQKGRKLVSEARGTILKQIESRRGAQRAA